MESFARITPVSLYYSAPWITITALNTYYLSWKTTYCQVWTLPQRSPPDVVIVEEQGKARPQVSDDYIDYLWMSSIDQCWQWHTENDYIFLFTNLVNNANQF
jgi:hypothetical protein